MISLQDLRDLDDLALLLRERDIVEQYASARFQHHTSQLANTAKLRTLRRDLARIKTVVRQRESEKGLNKGGLLASVDSKELREKTKYNKIRATFGAESKGD